MRPWLSDTVVDFLDRYVKKDHSVFEWGSGGSTVYLADKVRSIISVENDPEWHKQITDSLRSSDNANVILVSPDSGTCQDIMNLDACASYAKTLRHKIFRSYVHEIDNHEGQFDLIIVDGRARISCLKLAQSRVKIGGVILLDDSQRPRYKPGKDLFGMDEWNITVFAGKTPGSSTHIFRRIG